MFMTLGMCFDVDGGELCKTLESVRMTDQSALKRGNRRLLLEMFFLSRVSRIVNSCRTFEISHLSTDTQETCCRAMFDITTVTGPSTKYGASSLSAIVAVP